MGKSNQAGSINYYLWTKGEASTWYVVRERDQVRFPSFEAYYFNRGQWELDQGGYGPNPHHFHKRHTPITPEQAIKCIIGGPEYCYALQKELNAMQSV